LSHQDHVSAYRHSEPSDLRWPSMEQRLDYKTCVSARRMRPGLAEPETVMQMEGGWCLLVLGSQDT
jgi:hypothetical protein